MNPLSVAAFFALVACSFATSLYGYGYNPLSYASTLHAPIATYATHHAAPITYAAPAVVKSASYVAPAVHAVHTPVAVAAPAVVKKSVSYAAPAAAITYAAPAHVAVAAPAATYVKSYATPAYYGGYSGLGYGATTTKNKQRSVGDF
ncbi:hypothetical protein TNCV_17561 [Trichonephila clavipes]|nr:hypothetical protein TNCV_17561 [Trichonephila clavipes]